MIKKLSLATIVSALAFAVQPVGAVFAQVDSTKITNPAIGALGNDYDGAISGSLFTGFFITIWQALISVGALTVIVYFLWGGYEWIYAGGDSAKVQKARDKMTQAAIGMIILVSSFVIIGFISTLFFGTNFDILNPIVPKPGP
jgi:hypothetical protein